MHYPAIMLFASRNTVKNNEFTAGVGNIRVIGADRKSADPVL
jgi:hypothetical protein